MFTLALESSDLRSSAYTTDVGKQDQQNDLATARRMKTEDGNSVTEILEPSSVVIKFLDIKVQLINLLQEFDPMVIADQCKSLKSSVEGDILLLPSDFVDALKKSKTTSKLIHKLALYMNWCDHSILSTIVKFCNVPEAKTLLTQFDDSIDPSQPLMRYPIPAPSHHMVPYDTSTHTVLAVQLNLQIHLSTLRSVIDTRSLIQEKCEVTPHCFQLLAVAKTSHTVIYWTIPKQVASLITSKVQQYQSDLHQNGIQQVSVYPGTAFVIGSALTVGLFSFFTEVSFSYNITILLIIIHNR